MNLIIIFLCIIVIFFFIQQAISCKGQHSISYTLSRNQTVVVEYTHDKDTDMFQVRLNAIHAFKNYCVFKATYGTTVLPYILLDVLCDLWNSCS